MTQKHILPTVVIAQFFCTSLWFAGNGVLSELQEAFQLDSNAIGYLTSSVQFGFILGTLLFAILSISDRFSPSKVFFICALLGAGSNITMIWNGNTFNSLLGFRFFTGFFLAGIYPVGMKIAADYFDRGLGKSLGFLVGALVLGTGLPHLLKDLKGGLPWEYVSIATSVLAVLGGVCIILFVPDGPFRKAATQFEFSTIKNIFRSKKFRIAAFGYFGHMWELYAFWAFIPFVLTTYTISHPEIELNVPLLSFLIIGIGSLGCITSGYLSQRFGDKTIATWALSISFLCCVTSPIFILQPNVFIFILFLFIWGFAVIADSPLFSTLVAKESVPQSKGTALTLVNSIGFFITILSIELLNIMKDVIEAPYLLTLLAIGPMIVIPTLIRSQKK